MSVLAELRRRSVFRVAGAYVVVGWLLVQAAGAFEAGLTLPGWFDTVVIGLLVLGLPVALVLAWAFELTPEGVKRTAPAGPGEAPAPLARTDLVLIAALVAVLGVSLYQATRPQAVGGAGRTAPNADALSLAVLPFVNMSSDPEQEYFSDGLSEELLNVLAQIPELRVAGRTSSFAFKGRNEDLRAIGETLGVAHVLEGSVRKAGDRLRITAQLVSAADGYHLWSETYDRQLTDVFAVQEEIAMSVADALSVTLGVGDLDAPAGTEDVEVYDLYLRGMALARDPSSPYDFIRAADIFQGVLALDPDFTRARIALAGTFIPIAVLFPERADQAVAELEAVVADALARAPDDPGSHFADAILQTQRFNWLQAEQAFARGGEDHGGAFGSVPFPSIFLLNGGRAAEASERLARAAHIDPLAVDVTNFLQQALTIMGDLDAAETEYRRTTSLGLTAPPIEHMALMRVWNGDDDALIRARFDRYIEVQTVESALDAAVREVYDDPVAALAQVRAAAERPDMQDPTRQLFVAVYAAHYGDPDLAVAAMRRMLVDMKGPLAQALWLPDMAGARRLPAFKDLVRDLGLVDYWRATGNWGDFCRPLGDDDFECD